jgi:hypothetical protein
MKKRSWASKPFSEMTHIDYMNAIWAARIHAQGKFLLSYYATRYNFTTRENCFARIDTIARETGWSRGTVITWKKYLKALGWIVVRHRSETSDYVSVRLGEADPTIKAPPSKIGELSHDEARLDMDLLTDRKSNPY